MRTKLANLLLPHFPRLALYVDNKSAHLEQGYQFLQQAENMIQNIPASSELEDCTRLFSEYRNRLSLAIAQVSDYNGPHAPEIRKWTQELSFKPIEVLLKR